MQSVFALYAAGVQLSNFQSKNAELLQKKHELYPDSDTLTPTMTTITTEKTYQESLSDSPYFDTPLLQEALKEKLGKKILVEPTETVIDNQFSQITIHEQGEEFFEFLVQTLRNISAKENQIKEQLEKQKTAIFELIQRKVFLANLRYERASKELANKPTLPEKFKDLKDVIRYIKVAAKELIEEQFERKLLEISEKFSRQDFQSFSDKIQEFKDNITQTQDHEKVQNMIQEMAVLQKQVLAQLEKLEKEMIYELEPQTVFANLDQELTDLSQSFQRHLKPIKTGLKGGERLATNGHLTSDNGIFNLVIQGDGNLVFYKFSDPIWSSGTYGASRNPELFLDPKDGVLKMQAKGYYSNYTKPVNPKNSNYQADAYLKISNVGTFEIGGSNITKPWIPTNLIPASNTLRFPDSLPLRGILVSENQIYTLALHDDYNLILYEHANPIWNSGNFYADLKGKLKLSLTDQGALVLQNSKGKSEFVLIPPHPTFRGKVSLMVTNDGAITINSHDQELWNSKKDLYLAPVVF